MKGSLKGRMKERIRRVKLVYLAVLMLATTILPMLGSVEVLAEQKADEAPMLFVEYRYTAKDGTVYHVPEDCYESCDLSDNYKKMEEFYSIETNAQKTAVVLDNVTDGNEVTFLETGVIPDIQYSHFYWAGSGGPGVEDLLIKWERQDGSVNYTNFSYHRSTGYDYDDYIEYMDNFRKRAEEKDWFDSAYDSWIVEAEPAITHVELQEAFTSLHGQYQDVFFSPSHIYISLSQKYSNYRSFIYEVGKNDVLYNMDGTPKSITYRGPNYNSILSNNGTDYWAGYIYVKFTDEGENEYSGYAEGDMRFHTVAMLTFKENPLKSLTLSGTKTLDGKNLEKDEFTFQLQETDAQWNALPGTSPQTTANDAQGNFSFTRNFADTKKYYYVISEVSEDSDNIVYDERQYRITVNVTADSSEIEKMEVVSNAGGTPVECQAVEFANTYLGYIEIPGTKTLTGRPLEEDEFTFLLQETDEQWKAKPGKQPVQAKNDEKGAFSFEQKHLIDGTYYYEISEEAGALDKVTYDQTKYRVTVKVTDASAEITGITAVRDGKEETAAAVAFTNVYALQPVTIEGTKKLTGRTLQKGEFSFALQETNDQWEKLPNAAPETVQNDEQGNFSIEKMYAEQGTHYYILKEVPGNLAHVTYDGRTYHLTVTVDGDASTLTVTDENGADPGEIVFENSYKEPEKPKEPDKPTSSGTSRSSGSTETKVAAAKTGDAAPVEAYVLLLAASVLLTGTVLIRYRKKAKH